ncbi:MAG: hypothetical protein NBV68_13625 [Erythrobacter sp.]|uniref:hypothetical protein n=1 Tax=Erythrobacter sp. TaxID=1042 RepID=UPI0025FEC7F1|nr:hypothetical protein [Erythrobacter sp.]MCM0000419.1 hypothetical protein [Erythrobacter sp.]
MRLAVIPLGLLALLSACGPGGDEAAQGGGLIATDPVIARALHDPLMSDPDLASRNEAAAAIGFADSAALPVLAGSSAAAAAAREAMRIELLESGTLPDLPPAGDAPGGAVLGPMSGPEELLAAVGAPGTCAGELNEDFALAATLPPAAAIPPHAMVVQAGGSDAADCGLRIVRYLTPAAPEDVLQYHHVRAARAGLTPTRHAAPGDSISGTGEGSERLAVSLRKAAHGLTGVTLVYRAN